MSTDTERSSERSSLPDSQPVIEFRHAGYRLPDGRALLRDLSLVVQRGETLVLLGRSGAGKSTALKMINRMLEPTDGVVLVEGRSTLEGDPIELRRRIGYVIQEVGLFPHFTVEQNISLVPRLEHWPEVTEPHTAVSFTRMLTPGDVTHPQRPCDPGRLPAR